MSDVVHLSNGAVHETVVRPPAVACYTTKSQGLDRQQGLDSQNRPSPVCTKGAAQMFFIHEFLQGIIVKYMEDPKKRDEKFKEHCQRTAAAARQL